MLPVEWTRPVFARRPMQFPSRNPRSCRKTQNTPPPRFLSQLYHEVEVCRGREVSEATVTMGPFFDDCVEKIWEVLVRDRLVNIGIRPSASQLYNNETGCKAGDKCLFPHYKVDEQTNQEPKKKLLSKKRRKRWQDCCGNCEQCITIGLCIARFRCTRFSKAESLGDVRCRKSWNKFKGYDSLSLRFVKRVSGKRKDHRLGKTNVKVPHQRSPYVMKFEDRSHEETERQQRLCPKQGLESCQKQIQAQRKIQGCILLSRGGMGAPGCVNKGAGWKIVCSRLPERPHAYPTQQR